MGKRPARCGADLEAAVSAAAALSACPLSRWRVRATAESSRASRRCSTRPPTPASSINAVSSGFRPFQPGVKSAATCLVHGTRRHLAANPNALHDRQGRAAIHRRANGRVGLRGHGEREVVPASATSTAQKPFPQARPGCVSGARISSIGACQSCLFRWAAPGRRADYQRAQRPKVRKHRPPALVDPADARRGRAPAARSCSSGVTRQIESSVPLISRQRPSSTALLRHFSGCSMRWESTTIARSGAGVSGALSHGARDTPSKGGPPSGEMPQ